MVEPTRARKTSWIGSVTLIAIRGEIQAVIDGKADARQRPEERAATAGAVTSAEWDHPFSREQAAFAAVRPGEQALAVSGESTIHTATAT